MSKEIEFLKALDRTLKILGIKIANTDKSIIRVALGNSGNILNLYNTKKKLTLQSIAFLLEKEDLIDKAKDRYNQIKVGKYYSHDKSRSNKSVSMEQIRTEGVLIDEPDLKNLPKAKHEDVSAIFSNYLVEFFLSKINKDKTFLQFIGDKTQKNPLAFALNETEILKKINEFIPNANSKLIANLIKHFNDSQRKAIKVLYPELISYFDNDELTFAEIKRVMKNPQLLDPDNKSNLENASNLLPEDDNRIKLIKAIKELKESKQPDIAPSLSIFEELVANKLNLQNTIALLKISESISALIGQEATINLINHAISLQTSYALIKLKPDAALKAEFKIQKIALIDELLKIKHTELFKILNDNKETIIPFLKDTLIPFAEMRFLSLESQQKAALVIENFLEELSTEDTLIPSLLELTKLTLATKLNVTKISSAAIKLLIQKAPIIALLKKHLDDITPLITESLVKSKSITKIIKKIDLETIAPKIITLVIENMSEEISEKLKDKDIFESIKILLYDNEKIRIALVKLLQDHQTLIKDNITTIINANTEALEKPIIKGMNIGGSTIALPLMNFILKILPDFHTADEVDESENLPNLLGPIRGSTIFEEPITLKNPLETVKQIILRKSLSQDLGNIIKTVIECTTFTEDQTINGIIISQDLLNNILDNIKNNSNLVDNSLKSLKDIITNIDAIKDREENLKKQKNELANQNKENIPESGRSKLQAEINKLSAELMETKRKLNLAIVGLLKEVTSIIPANESLVTIIKASVSTKYKAFDSLIDIGAKIFNNMLESPQLPNILNLTEEFLRNKKPTIIDQITLVSDIFKEIQQNQKVINVINEVKDGIAFTEDQTINEVLISKDLLNKVFDNIKNNLKLVDNSLKSLKDISTKSDTTKDKEMAIKKLKAQLLIQDNEKAPKSERSKLQTEINKLSAELIGPKRELNLAIVGLLKEATQILPKNENLLSIMKASVTTENDAVNGLVGIGAEIFNNMLERAQLPNILNLTEEYLKKVKPTAKDQITLVSSIFKEIKKNVGAVKVINYDLKSYLSENAGALGELIEDFANKHPLLKHMNINGERLVDNLALHCNMDKIATIMESLEKSKYFSLIFEIGTYAITVACKFIGAKISKFFNDLTKNEQYSTPEISDILQIKPGSLLSNPTVSSLKHVQESL